MTTNNMQELLLAYHRGIEVGREAARHETAEFATLTAKFDGHNRPVVSLPPKPAPAVALKPTRVIDVKKAAGPRTKGVKEAILALIASVSMSPAAIIAATGFKGTSVRATLMSLKKAGLAMSDDGRWIATTPVGHGNSEEHIHATD